MPSIGIIGAGVIGAAIGRKLALTYPGLEVTILEKESRHAVHQTGHNSGVVHAGLYYVPGSLKARLCQRGRVLIKEYCQEKQLPYYEVGKTLVAGDREAVSRLAAIEERAVANGVGDVRRLSKEQLLELEPLAVGLSGLHSPSTAITDYAAITAAYLADVEEHGGEVLFDHEVQSISTKDRVTVTTAQGQHTFDRLISCGGLQSDRLARMAGITPSVRIIPFRGKYFHLNSPESIDLRGLIYPVPNPKYPFLGVHVTRHVDGSVSIGPNAVLSLDREEYRRFGVDPRDLGDILGWPGFWPMAGKHWITGAKEMAITTSKRFFVSQVEKVFSGITDIRQVVPVEAGTRAQAVDRRGNLIDDFQIEQHGPLTFILNAPSPAATSSMAIAEHVVAEFMDPVAAS